jgi:hypothetical protein
MSDPPSAGDFLKGLSEAEYARISALLDQSIDMIPSDRGVWLATLERDDPKSAAILRGMFAAQVAYTADNFLEDMPSVPADPTLGAGSGTAAWAACGSPSVPTGCSGARWRSSWFIRRS